MALVGVVCALSIADLVFPLVFLFLVGCGSASADFDHPFLNRIFWFFIGSFFQTEIRL